MLIKATQKYTRQAPRKVRLVANAVKALSINKAIEQLGLLERRASTVVLKALSQAAANAQNNLGLDINLLKIHSIIVDGGPSYKRFRAVSRGRAHRILKRTCHVSVTLISPDEKVKNIKDAKTSAKTVVKASTLAETSEKQIQEPSPKSANTNKLVEAGRASKLKATGNVVTTSPTRVLRHTTHK